VREQKLKEFKHVLTLKWPITDVAASLGRSLSLSFGQLVS